jgi:hypothetical protein
LTKDTTLPARWPVTEALWVRKGQRGFEQGSVTLPLSAPPASTSVAVNVTIPVPG